MKQRDSIAVNYSFIIQNVASIAHFANSRIQFKSMVRFQLDSITCILLFSLFTHQIYIQFFSFYRTDRYDFLCFSHSFCLVFFFCSYFSCFPFEFGHRISMSASITRVTEVYLYPKLT